MTDVPLFRYDAQSGTDKNPGAIRSVGNLHKCALRKSEERVWNQQKLGELQDQVGQKVIYVEENRKGE